MSAPAQVAGDGPCRSTPWIRDCAFFAILRTLTCVLNSCPSHCLKRYLGLPLGLRMASGVALHAPLRVSGFRKVMIGERTVINPRCHLDNRRPISIGRDVSIANDVHIYTLGHDPDDAAFGLKGAPVTIGDQTCIFAGAMVMPGVQLGRGCVVYPGSVVTRDVPEFAIVGGNPARFIRERRRDLSYQLDHRTWFAV